MRRLPTILLCAAAFMASFVASAADRRAPGFALMDSQGAWHDLADYRGKVVLLAFIQTTCPHCATFAEVLEQTQAKYRDKVAVLAVVNPPDTPDKVRDFLAGHKITFPIVFDVGQMAYSYILSPNMTFPRLFLIDGGGTIRADNEYGPLTRDIFEGNGLGPAIDRLLNNGRKM